MPKTGDVFKVNRILKGRTRKGKRQYLVRWKGYNQAHDSWEPAENILDRDLIERFEEKLKRKVQYSRSKKEEPSTRKVGHKTVERTQDSSSESGVASRTRRKASSLLNATEAFKKARTFYMNRSYEEQRNEEDTNDDSDVDIMNTLYKNGRRNVKIGSIRSSNAGRRLNLGNDDEAKHRRSGSIIINLSDVGETQDEMNRGNRIPKFGGQGDFGPPVLSPHVTSSQESDAGDQESDIDDSGREIFTSGHGSHTRLISVSNHLPYHSNWAMTTVKVKDMLCNFIEFV